MASPNLLVPPIARGSGEMAALKKKVPSKLLRLPRCNSEGKGGVGSISYHLTSAPEPPKTVCCVQRAISPGDGSKAVIAWVLRASRVSSTYLLPGCGALAGMLYGGTSSLFAELTAMVPLALLVTL